MGAAVIGISSDSVDSHKNFCNELDLQFTLLSDEGGAVRKEYGVPKTLGLLDGRVTYIIDKTGTVVKVFDNQFAPEKHVEEAVAALESAKVKA
jgi:peroxiredoxin Q/BCP